MTVNTEIKEKDVMAVASNADKVLFENEKVRVLELRFRPGEEVPMHSHPETIAYAINDGHHKWTFPDGAKKDMEIKAGKVIHSEPFTHAVVNVGNTETRLLVIEMK